MHKNRLLGLLYYIKFNTFAGDCYGMRDGGLLQPMGWLCVRLCPAMHILWHTSDGRGGGIAGYSSCVYLYL